MKAINQAERQKAFLSFLLFFAITIVVVITIVFFSIQVPFRQNDQLREQMTRIENEKIFLSGFKTKMEETMSLLDSTTRVDNPILLDTRITRNISEMDAMINDSISMKNIYSHITEILVGIQTAKQQVRKAAGNEAVIADLKQKAIDLKSDLDKCQTANNNFINNAISANRSK